MILLDTCALLWIVLDQDGLSDKARSVLREEAGGIQVSPVSAFEIGQKHVRGKLKLRLAPRNWFPRALELHGLRETPLDSAILLEAAALPDLHRDPFDRILVATARRLKLDLLTPDPLIARYPGVRTVW